jgi:hypothetical protein
MRFTGSGGTRSTSSRLILQEELSLSGSRRDRRQPMSFTDGLQLLIVFRISDSTVRVHLDF